MATYAELYDFLSNEVFAKQLRMALYRLASNVRANSSSSPAQVQWADRVLRDAIQLPLRFIATRVLARAGVAAAVPNVPDSAVQQAVNELLDELVKEG